MFLTVCIQDIFKIFKKGSRSNDIKISVRYFNNISMVGTVILWQYFFEISRILVLISRYISTQYFAIFSKYPFASRVQTGLKFTQLKTSNFSLHQVYYILYKFIRSDAKPVIILNSSNISFSAAFIAVASQKKFEIFVVVNDDNERDILQHAFPNVS